MFILSLTSFLLLGGYLLLTAMRFGVPDMVSDTYYQLQGTTGSEILPFKRERNFGWVFSLVMVTVAALMMACLLGTGEGIQCLAFLGCGGLAFVGLAPNYLDKDAYKVHKSGAIVAAIGCVGWCLSVCWWVTIAVVAAYALYLLAVSFLKAANSIWYIYRADFHPHPWYWAEVAGFADVFLTLWEY